MLYDAFLDGKTEITITLDEDGNILPEGTRLSDESTETGIDETEVPEPDMTEVPEVDMTEVPEVDETEAPEIDETVETDAPVAEDAPKTLQLTIVGIEVEADAKADTDAAETTEDVIVEIQPEGEDAEPVTDRDVEDTETEADEVPLAPEPGKPVTMQVKVYLARTGTTVTLSISLADFNGDGVLNTKDLVYLSRNIGKMATTLNALVTQYVLTAF